MTARRQVQWKVEESRLDSGFVGESPAAGRGDQGSLSQSTSTTGKAISMMLRRMDGLRPTYEDQSLLKGESA